MHCSIKNTNKELGGLRGLFVWFWGIFGLGFLGFGVLWGLGGLFVFASFCFVFCHSKTLYPWGSFITAFLQVETHVHLNTSIWVPFFRIRSTCLGKALLPEAIPHFGAHLSQLSPEKTGFRDLVFWRKLPDSSSHLNSWTWKRVRNKDKSNGTENDTTVKTKQPS